MPESRIRSPAQLVRGPDRGMEGRIYPRPGRVRPNLTPLALNVVNVRCSVFKDAPRMPPMRASTCFDAATEGAGSALAPRRAGVPPRGVVLYLRSTYVPTRMAS